MHNEQVRCEQMRCEAHFYERKECQQVRGGTFGLDQAPGLRRQRQEQTENFARTKRWRLATYYLVSFMVRLLKQIVLTTI